MVTPDGYAGVVTGAAACLRWAIAVKSLVEDGFKQAAAFGLGGRELLFQPVTESHQFVHLGDDAVLFGEWWEGQRKVFKFALCDVL